MQVIEPSLSAFARDASRFVVTYNNTILQSAPHIYLSALPFAPEESTFAQRYQPMFSNTISFISSRDKKWPAIVNVFRGHTSDVTSASFSPDGRRIASGSIDNTVRIWDSGTGEILVLQKHGQLPQTRFTGNTIFSLDEVPFNA